MSNTFVTMHYRFFKTFLWPFITYHNCHFGKAKNLPKKTWTSSPGRRCSSLVGEAKRNRIFSERRVEGREGMTKKAISFFVLLHVAVCRCQEGQTNVQECSLKQSADQIEVDFSSIQDLQDQLENNPDVRRFYDQHIHGLPSCGDSLTTTESITSSMEGTSATQEQTSNIESLVKTQPATTIPPATPPASTTSMLEDTTLPVKAFTGCNITHEGKCFVIFLAGYQNYNIKKAADSCKNIGFQLGNIYNQEHYDKIESWLRDHARKSYSGLWTGMTLTKKGNILLSSNETSNWNNVTWYEDYPMEQNVKPLLAIKVRRLIGRIFECGIINSLDSGLEGAFCEIDL